MSEIGQQTGDRPVDLGALRGVILPQATMGVPGAGAAVGAMEDLYEPDAALDQALAPDLRHICPNGRSYILVKAV